MKFYLKTSKLKRLLEHVILDKYERKSLPKVSGKYVALKTKHLPFQVIVYLFEVEENLPSKVRLHLFEKIYINNIYYEVDFEKLYNKKIKNLIDFYIALRLLVDSKSCVEFFDGQNWVMIELCAEIHDSVDIGKVIIVSDINSQYVTAEITKNNIFNNMPCCDILRNFKLKIRNITSMTVTFSNSENKEILNPITNIFTDFKNINKITNGFQFSDVIVSLGIGGVLNSLFIPMIKKQLNEKYNFPILEVINSDHPKIKLYNAELDSYNVPEYKINSIWMRFFRILNDQSIYTENEKKESFEKFKQFCLEMKKQCDFKIIIINAPNVYNLQNKKDDFIAKTLKQLAIEINVLIIIQIDVFCDFKLNINMNQTLNDITQFGNYSEFADVIFLNVIPEFQNVCIDEFMNSTYDKAEIIILKTKGGNVGKVSFDIDYDNEIVNEIENINSRYWDNVEITEEF